MSKFKVGDKVRLLINRDDWSDIRPHMHEVCTIFEIDNDGEYAVQYPDGNTSGAVFRDNELELVKGKKGRPKKEKPKTHYVILKESCSNYITNFKCTKVEAYEKLKSHGTGHGLYVLEPVAICKAKIVKVKTPVKRKRKK